MTPSSPPPTRRVAPLSQPSEAPTPAEGPGISPPSPGRFHARTVQVAAPASGGADPAQAADAVLPSAKRPRDEGEVQAGPAPRRIRRRPAETIIWQRRRDLLSPAVHALHDLVDRCNVRRAPDLTRARRTAWDAATLRLEALADAPEMPFAEPEIQTAIGRLQATMQSHLKVSHEEHHALWSWLAHLQSFFGHKALEPGLRWSAWTPGPVGGLGRRTTKARPQRPVLEAAAPAAPGAAAAGASDGGQGRKVPRASEAPGRAARAPTAPGSPGTSLPHRMPRGLELGELQLPDPQTPDPLPTGPLLLPPPAGIPHELMLRSAQVVLDSLRDPAVLKGLLQVSGLGAARHAVEARQQAMQELFPLLPLPMLLARMDRARAGLLHRIDLPAEHPTRMLRLAEMEAGFATLARLPAPAGGGAPPLLAVLEALLDPDTVPHARQADARRRELAMRTALLEPLYRQMPPAWVAPQTEALRLEMHGERRLLWDERVDALHRVARSRLVTPPQPPAPPELPDLPDDASLPDL